MGQFAPVVCGAKRLADFAAAFPRDVGGEFPEISVFRRSAPDESRAPVADFVQLIANVVPERGVVPYVSGLDEGVAEARVLSPRRC